VIDEGPGPPAHLASHLFEPFVSARAGGTGLGLALVAKVVAEHGGLVECDRAGGCTIFRVLLPIAPPAP
jgi:two-component system nitrogen regulation sensor histidine kinase GlnL